MFSFLFKELKKYGVTTLVRVCDATYDQAPIEKEGIQVLVSCLENWLKMWIFMSRTCGDLLMLWGRSSLAKSSTR